MFDLHSSPYHLKRPPDSVSSSAPPARSRKKPRPSTPPPPTPPPATDTSSTRTNTTSATTTTTTTYTAPPTDSPMPDAPTNVSHSAVSRFRLGFKPGCEKCALRVPGHYSHF